jgi:hypothetical protein
LGASLSLSKYFLVALQKLSSVESGLYGAYRSHVSGRQTFRKEVDFSVRETFESALVLGRKALETLGIEPERAGAVIELVRSREQERLVLQQAGGDAAGIDLLRARIVQEPLREPEGAKPKPSIRRRRRSSKARPSAAALNRHIRSRSGRPSGPTARETSPAVPRPG